MVDNNEMVVLKSKNISIIKISHKILKKAFSTLLRKGDLWAGDKAGICDLGRSLEIIENYTVKEWMVWIGTDILKMVCTDTKNEIIQQW